jgi:hypothetical protein
MLTVSPEAVANLSAVMRTAQPVETTAPRRRRRTSTTTVRFHDHEGDKTFITVRGTPTFL